MLAPAVAFALRYPLRGNHQGLTDIGKLAGYGVPEFAGYVGGLALMFLLYGLALRECRRLPAGRALPVVFVGGGALALAFAWMYPVNAIDLFLYAVRSRLWTAHGVNPQAALPVAYPDDPWMRFASAEWADDVSPYGPLWNVIAAPITGLAGDGLLPALAGFKLLALVSVLAGGWAIARTVATARPDAAADGALLYLWNPLVLWEGVGNGHNDVVMAVPLLLALLAWARRRDRLVIPLLVAAALIKYVTLLAIPLAAVALWRRAEDGAARARLAAWSGGLSLLAAAVALFPFYDPGAALASLAAQGDIFLTSPAAMAVGLLRDAYPSEEVRRWARAVGQALVLAVLVWWGIELWQRPRRLPRATYEALFAFLLVATWNFRAWYVIWPVALAAVLPWGWPAWRAIAWSAGGLAGYALFIWGWHWWDADFYAIQNVGVPLMTGPALALTLIELGRSLRRRSTGPGEAAMARGPVAVER
jgi:hypothetical protein